MKATSDGRYRYDGIVLGQGAFGTVLKASDTLQENEAVAIKIVRAQKSLKEYFLRKTPAVVKEVRREAGLLSRLEHQNVVAIRDYFEFKTEARRMVGLAIVTEYCQRGNLQTRLEELVSDSGRLDKQLRFRWYKQLATALRFIHSEEVIHRDLKPHNVLVGAADNLKIADVGLAKALYDVNADQASARYASYVQYMQTVAGTPAYMAPEVFEKHYTKSADVFSLGLIMFVICELPNPLCPTARFGTQKSPLGVLMCNTSLTQTVKATDLLQACHCSQDETELFDGMLQFNHHDRPTMDVVVSYLEAIAARVHEQRNGAEARAIPITTDSRNQKGWKCVLQ